MQVLWGRAEGAPATGGHMPNGRAWHYWSRNKLEILAKYLPAFTTASKRASECLYLDLMAGQPENRDHATGEKFDGSARLAMATRPPFTRLAFGEMPRRAAAIQRDLKERFPDRDFRVYPGDCNQTIHQMLADLDDVRWAPTFAFLDQQAAEVHWDTMAAIAAFRRGKTKAEQWILWSPAMLIRELEGPRSEEFAKRVDLMYGDRKWRPIWHARHEGLIEPDIFRAEMVNLVRYQLEVQLGYKHTARIPMRMANGLELYDMVFATDHEAGIKIMSHLYAKAAEREPKMRQEALDRMKPASPWSEEGLFPMEATGPARVTPAWQPDQVTDPSIWWTI